GCVAAHERDPVAVDVLLDHPPEIADDLLLAVHEVRNRDVLLDGVIDPVEAALPQAREVEGGFAQGLAGDRPGVDTGSAQLLLPFDERHALSEVGGLSRALLAGGTRADDDELE